MIELLSGIYAILIVVLGFVLSLATALRQQQPDEESYYIEAFEVYIYIVSVFFLIYVHTYLLRRQLNDHCQRQILKTGESHKDGRCCRKRKSAQAMTMTSLEMTHRCTEQRCKDEHNNCVTYDAPGVNFYLRLGAIGFGTGSMVQDGFRLAQYIDGASMKFHCLGPVNVLTVVLHMTFMFCQTFFIFKSHKIVVHKHTAVVSFGFMHMIAANVCVWFATTVAECREDFLQMDRPPGSQLPDGTGQGGDTIIVTANHSGAAIARHDVTTNIHRDGFQDLLRAAVDDTSCRLTPDNSLALKASPYLFPCTIEYSVIAAAILYKMYRNVGRTYPYNPDHVTVGQVISSSHDTHASCKEREKSCRSSGENICKITASVHSGPSASKGDVRAPEAGVAFNVPVGLMDVTVSTAATETAKPIFLGIGTSTTAASQTIQIQGHPTKSVSAADVPAVASSRRAHSGEAQSGRHSNIGCEDKNLSTSGLGETWRESARNGCSLYELESHDYPHRKSVYCTTGGGRGRELAGITSASAINGGRNAVCCGGPDVDRFDRVALGLSCIDAHCKAKAHEKDQNWRLEGEGHFNGNIGHINDQRDKNVQGVCQIHAACGQYGGGTNRMAHPEKCLHAQHRDGNRCGPGLCRNDSEHANMENNSAANHVCSQGHWHDHWLSPHGWAHRWGAHSNAAGNHVGGVNCDKSNKGLFFGLFATVLTLVAVSCYFVFEDTLPNTNLSSVTFFATETLLLVALTVGVVLAFVQIRQLSFCTDDTSVDGLDSSLLVAALFGVFALECFHLVSSLSTVSNGDVISMLAVGTALLAIVEAASQTVFVIDGLRRRAESPEQVSSKPGRASVTFVLLANLALWIVCIFEVKKADNIPIHRRFYGALPWNIISHLFVPMIIFFRFHSTVCLAEIWVNAYVIKHN